MSGTSTRTVTELLRAYGEGEERAGEQLLARVYTELRHMAGGQMAHTPPGQTLQPTALVHEAYLRLVEGSARRWEDRRHFFFAAARAMRDILVEEARRKAALRHGGGWRRTNLQELSLAIDAPPEELLAVDEVLTRLTKGDARKRQLVELRFFAGLSEEEAAHTMGVSVRTVRRDWAFLRTRIFRELQPPAPD